MKKSNISETVNFELITTNYRKQGKKWLLDTTETTTVNGTNYNNCIDAKSFFTNLGGYERHEKSYTSLGNIVTTITSISPNKEDKTVRHYAVK